MYTCDGLHMYNNKTYCNQLFFIVMSLDKNRSVHAANGLQQASHVYDTTRDQQSQFHACQASDSKMRWKSQTIRETADRNCVKSEPGEDTSLVGVIGRRSVLMEIGIMDSNSNTCICQCRTSVNNTKLYHFSLLKAISHHLVDLRQAKT